MPYKGFEKPIQNGEKVGVIFNHSLTMLNTNVVNEYYPVIFEVYNASGNLTTLSTLFSFSSTTEQQSHFGKLEYNDIPNSSKILLFYGSCTNGYMDNTRPAIMNGLDPYTVEQYVINSWGFSSFTPYNLNATDYHEFIYSMFNWISDDVCDSGATLYTTQYYGVDGINIVEVNYPIELLPDYYVDIAKIGHTYNDYSKGEVFYPGLVKEGHFNSLTYDSEGGGSEGYQGYQGVRGPQGNTGNNGNQGPRGYQGPTGSGGSTSLNVVESANMYTYAIGYNSAHTDTLFYDPQIFMHNGYMYSISDENKKNFLGDIVCDLNILKNIPKKYFKWADGSNDQTYIGTSAQKLAEIYPELVNIDGDGNYGVSYERLSIVALAAIDKLYEENNDLRERLDNLEKLFKILMNYD